MSQAVISNKGYSITQVASTIDYPITRIVNPTRIVRINETLPFRIRFINVGIDPLDRNNIPGIGLQVIGYSNYIL
jgi:hypothetical protein